MKTFKEFKKSEFPRNSNEFGIKDYDIEDLELAWNESASEMRKSMRCETCRFRSGKGRSEQEWYECDKPYSGVSECPKDFGCIHWEEKQ